MNSHTRFAGHALPSERSFVSQITPPKRRHRTGHELPGRCTKVPAGHRPQPLRTRTPAEASRPRCHRRQLLTQLGAALVVERKQAPARVDDLFEPLVTHGHSHRDLALVDGELTGKGEQLVAQPLRARLPEALR